MKILKLTKNKTIILTVAAVVVISLISSLLYMNKHTSAAAIDLEGRAQILNTNGYLNFTDYSANVTTSNIGCSFDGYAWSSDIGWVAFGTTDNPDGPVTCNLTTGIVSGKAHVLNDGSTIDFNSAPYGSNVRILSSGDFTGYAWSTALGWINFTGVSAPGISLISPPVNDSLTFKNPYTSNIAVADDTTEWTFEAKVTDADGPTNINYVELRLANSADSTQPYDSLKFRWTESTDTFSEQADTQSAATITSTSSDSSSSGNQWTLNFKIKFNDNFLAKDTNYAVELYSIDDSSASDTDNYADKYQVKLLSISIEVDSPTIEFGNLLPGSVLTDTTVCTVTTNCPNGYSLLAHDNVAGGNSVLLHTDLATRIADYLGTITTPTSWSGTGLGISLYLATSKEVKWGSGTTETDLNNKYAGVPETATIIHEKTGSPTSADTNSVGYKLVVPNTQKTGNYSGTITYTATGVLN